MQSNNQNFIYTLPAILLVLLLVVIIPTNVSAASPTYPPVPSYSTVTTTAEQTTVTVPTNLIDQWRGLFTINSRSVIIQGEFTLAQIIERVLLQSKFNEQVRTYKYDPRGIYKWTEQLAQTTNAVTAEPTMKIKNSRVVEFVPPTYGKALDRYASTINIIEALQDGKTTAKLAVHTTAPKNDLVKLNDLGIKELIGRGESKFSGSPSNRRHNIKVGVEKMKGLIVKPGEEFSFNKYLGPVEAYTGFLPELVIKSEGTVPEFGGGLCQVSSTVFRAAMHAGLPITQRRNHSYAVQYYAPQGTDATIYPGVIDIKFMNDTGHSILIWPHFITPDYLVFDFYGTYDNRAVELGNPYSYDKKSDGSLKSTWTRSVTKNGDTKKDTFNSVYQPPAKFHRQESFASAPGTPTPKPPVTPFVGPKPTPTDNPPQSSPTPTQTTSEPNIPQL